MKLNGKNSAMSAPPASASDSAKSSYFAACPPARPRYITVVHVMQYQATDEVDHFTLRA
jgi:hypothetical protein